MRSSRPRAKRGIAATRKTVVAHRACGAERLERISKPPQENDGAAELQEAEEVLGLVVPAECDSTEALQPGEKAFDLPAATVATKGPAILLPAARPGSGALGRDELDAAASEPLRERVAVESLVTDQLRRDFLEGGVEDVVDEADVVLRAISNAYGERKTSAVCNRHDLRRIAGTASSDAGPPFLAPA